MSGGREGDACGRKIKLPSPGSLHACGGLCSPALLLGPGLRSESLLPVPHWPFPARALLSFDRVEVKIWVLCARLTVGLLLLAVDRARQHLFIDTHYSLHVHACGCFCICFYVLETESMLIPIPPIPPSALGVLLVSVSPSQTGEPVSHSPQSGCSFGQFPCWLPWLPCCPPSPQGALPQPCGPLHPTWAAWTVAHLCRESQEVLRYVSPGNKVGELRTERKGRRICPVLSYQPIFCHFPNECPTSALHNPY